MASRVLVVGSGCVGLRTALELLQRNVKVILQAPRHPLHPSTCSVVAAGLWMPVHVTDPRTDQWALETLDELLSMAMETKHRDLVEILPAIVLKRNHSGPSVQDFTIHQSQGVPGEAMSKPMSMHSVFPEWTTDPRLDFQHLTVEMLAWQNIVHRLRIPPEDELKAAGYWYAWMFRTPIVNTPKMLDHLLAQVTKQAQDINVETNHYFTSVEEMCQTARELHCDAVVNCTGFGAASLTDNTDRNMVPGRGVTLHFDRATTARRDALWRHSTTGDELVHDAVLLADEPPWATDTLPAYLIPRGQTIVLGGTMLKGDTEAQMRDEERQHLLRTAQRLGIDVEQSPPVGEMIGYRPYRTPNIRVERDDDHSTPDLLVVHNYGHGGSGWTINVGAAKACADLLLK